jgi:hypothetical protein
MYPLWSLALMGSLLGAGPAGAGPSLWAVPQGPEGSAAAAVRAYVPREGDIVFYHNSSRWWEFLFAMAGTAPPTHCGIVVSVNGAPVLLESAPDDGTVGGLRVCLLEANSRLQNFEYAMWVRRLKRPLTSEQSNRLTQFALAQEGKPYGMLRLVFQVTPFRAHGTLRPLFGRTELNRWTWICSELVAASCAAVGLIDGGRYPANAAYPLDIFDDRYFDLSAVYEPAEVLRNGRPTDPADPRSQAGTR